MDPVAAQYEAYPYPARDPAAEKTRLIVGSPSNLPELNHYLFAGRRDFARPFRALVAGGGTGDAAIMLAQQLADSAGPGGDAGEVVYLDLSAAAREIAEARAEVRGLDNLSFHTGSLLDLPDLGLGRFDYIDCCGVLHHLEDPPAGLAALAAVLAEDGGIGLMVYAPYGRSGVYPLQAMLRQLAGELPLAEQVTLAKRLIAVLPETNGFRRNPFLGDHRRGDAELVDLLLHARDRAYTVAELAALVTGAGLTPLALIEPARYRPESYLAVPAVLKRLAGLDWLERAAFAERLAGNVRKHLLYAVRSGTPETRIAAPEDPETVPLLFDLEGPALARAVQRDLTLKAEFDGLALRFPLPRLAPAILQRIDGRRSLAAIHDALQGLDRGLDWPAFLAQFRETFAALNGINRLFLRRPPAG
ncbi:MAG: class I SAM-dependent methyltransferase [Kiloniellales bacterium]|nr:class I SAM-dependent methyltransferase [Kiloniellales bacterium]